MPDINQKDEITHLRNHIDLIDDELFLILDKRIQLAKKIIDVKEKLALPRNDASRENEILSRIALNPSLQNQKAILNVMKSVFQAGKAQL